MRNAIEILNPLPGGLKRTSTDRAQSFVRRGLAVMEGAKLRFLDAVQRARSEEEEFQRNRGGIIYWNGTRSHYVEGRDTAMYPPGCNVAFKPPDWIRI
ncbi:MAG: hypothetical protein JW730_18425 [Anaerolineales bacterium]|nr:hypothetical protein [Anaerolineales bacterium]